MPSLKEHWKVYLENAWYAALLYIVGFVTFRLFGWESGFKSLELIDLFIYPALTLIYTTLDVKDRVNKKGV